MPSPEERMTQLAESFPALALKLEGAHGFDPWNALTLTIAMKPWSPSEKLIANFLLSVWNSDEAASLTGEPFNVVEAFKRWDRGNWAAFQRWAQNPFFC